VPSSAADVVAYNHGVVPHNRVEKYRTMVSVVDGAIGRLRAGLAARGLGENTAIVLLSDHGESLRENPRLPEYHGRFLYNPLVHVPLAVIVPGLEPSDISHPVSLLDVSHTLRDLLAVPGDAAHEDEEGESLLPLLVDAPPSLFERKMIGSKRALTNGHNPPAIDVKRPLILLVEDDENVQLIVRTVVSSMGYGFVVGANGQEGLTLAREYNPDLILSDAFMPKLDGREMCRLLKEDPSTARSKAIIMTGLYTDRKYRNEALDYFKVDDYVAKPLAVDDLIKLFKKHLPQEVTAH
jgi:CheY-like chemotaxis protein